MGETPQKGGPTKGSSDDRSVRYEKKFWDEYLHQETSPLRKCHSVASFFSGIWPIWYILDIPIATYTSMHRLSSSELLRPTRDQSSCLPTSNSSLAVVPRLICSSAALHQFKMAWHQALWLAFFCAVTLLCPCFGLWHHQTVSSCTDTPHCFMPLSLLSFFFTQKILTQTLRFNSGVCSSTNPSLAPQGCLSSHFCVSILLKPLSFLRIVVRYAFGNKVLCV